MASQLFGGATSATARLAPTKTAALASATRVGRSRRAARHTWVAGAVPLAGAMTAAHHAPASATVQATAIGPARSAPNKLRLSAIAVTMRPTTTAVFST